MDRTAAQLWLTGWFASTTAASALFGEALDASRVADATGRGPSETGWVETVDQWLAAAYVATLLALSGAMLPARTVTEFASEGTTVKLQGGPVDWLALAAQFRGMSPLWQAFPGVGVIEVAPLAGLIPRSADLGLLP